MLAAKLRGAFQASTHRLTAFAQQPVSEMVSGKLSARVCAANRFMKASVMFDSGPGSAAYCDSIVLWQGIVAVDVRISVGMHIFTHNGFDRLSICAKQMTGACGHICSGAQCMEVFGRQRKVTL